MTMNSTDLALKNSSSKAQTDSLEGESTASAMGASKASGSLDKSLSSDSKAQSIDQAETAQSAATQKQHLSASYSADTANLKTALQQKASTTNNSARTDKTEVPDQSTTADSTNSFNAMSKSKGRSVPKNTQQSTAATKQENKAQSAKVTIADMNNANANAEVKTAVGHTTETVDTSVKQTNADTPLSNQAHQNESIPAATNAQSKASAISNQADNEGNTSHEQMAGNSVSANNTATPSAPTTQINATTSVSSTKSQTHDSAALNEDAVQVVTKDSSSSKNSITETSDEKSIDTATTGKERSNLAYDVASQAVSAALAPSATLSISTAAPVFTPSLADSSVMSSASTTSSSVSSTSMGSTLLSSEGGSSTQPSSESSTQPSNSASTIAEHKGDSLQGTNSSHDLEANQTTQDASSENQDINSNLAKSENLNNTAPINQTVSASAVSDASSSVSKVADTSVNPESASTAKAEPNTIDPLHQTIPSADEMSNFDDGVDFSAMIAEAQAAGISIMKNAVLSNDGQTAIMGLENLRNNKKPAVKTHIILGANNEQIISTVAEDDEPDIPTPPRDPATYAAALAAVKERKAQEARREAEKEKAKKEAESKRVLNHTSKSLDDFNFGHDRTLEPPVIPDLQTDIPKNAASSSGMGNGMVSNIVDNKDPYAGRENRPHERFGSKVVDFDNSKLSQAEIARSRLRQSLAQDSIDEERERARLIQRGREHQERERQERERIEREQQLKTQAELERRNKERLERERLEQERLEQQRLEQQRLEQKPAAQSQNNATLNQDYAPLQNALPNALPNDGGLAAPVSYPNYADASDFDGIAAPVTEKTPHYQLYNNLDVPAMMPKELNTTEDQAPAYMVGQSKRHQPIQTEPTAMFVQGDEDEPSPYVCGVNARRLSESDLRKRQQQAARNNAADNSSQNAHAAYYSGNINGNLNSTPNGNLNGSSNGNFTSNLQDNFNGSNNLDPNGVLNNNPNVNQNAAQNLNQNNNFDGDLRLQPGFGSGLNFVQNMAGQQSLPEQGLNGAYSGLYPTSATAPAPEGNTEHAAFSQTSNTSEQLYWSPGQSTAEFQAAKANQILRSQQLADQMPQNANGMNGLSAANQQSKQTAQSGNPPHAASDMSNGSENFDNSKNFATAENFAGSKNFTDSENFAVNGYQNNEERVGHMPTGMGDGALSSNGSQELQTLSAAAGIEGSTKPQNSGPHYMVGPAHPINQRADDEEEDEGPVYAVGPQRINAKVEAKLQADRLKLNSRIASNTSQGQISSQTTAENDDFSYGQAMSEYAQALAEAARESIAAPQSEVIKRARMMAAQVGQSNAAQLNDSSLLSDTNSVDNSNANIMSTLSQSTQTAQAAQFTPSAQIPQSAPLDEENVYAPSALTRGMDKHQPLQNGTGTNSSQLNYAAADHRLDYAEAHPTDDGNLHHAANVDYNKSSEPYLNDYNNGNYEGENFENAFNAELNSQLQTGQADLAQMTPEQMQSLASNLPEPSPADNFNNLQNREQVGLGIMVMLYIRQLCASFFTHTTLPVLMPHLARNLGPCYPSSMALPFFFVGLISAFVGRMTTSLLPVSLGSGLTFLIYLLLTGLAAYRGIYKICAYMNRRRHDVVLIAASVCVPMICFIWITENLFRAAPGIIEPTLAFAFASMLSAAAASTLSWNVQQDPIDSCGTMTTKGMLLVIVVCFMAAFGLLHYIVGLSVLGVTFIVRLVFGYIIVKNSGTAHRSYINALQLITFFAILLDLSLLKTHHYDLLSASTLEFVDYLERLLRY